MQAPFLFLHKTVVKTAISCKNRNKGGDNMNLYQEIARKRCVTREDFKKLAGTDSAAAWHIKTFLEKGYIERVRHDLYAVISLETGQPIANRFQLASAAAKDACVSHHSAFEYYGVANQVFYEVYFTSQKRLQDFYYDGIDYRCLPSRGTVGIIEEPTGVRVTSLERTVIDSIANFKKIGGLEELLRCLLLVPTLAPDKLLEALELYHNGKLYQKTGYLLESFQQEFTLPDSFFVTCEERSSNSKTYFSNNHKDCTLHKRWKLYAPADLSKIFNKGVNYLDATI